MAMRFGKQEKIAAGVVLCVLTIFAVHFFVFGSKVQRYAEVQNQLTGQPTLPEPQSLPTEAEFSAFLAGVQEQESDFWASLYQTSLLTPLEFTHLAEPVLPEDPTEENEAAYEQEVADYAWKKERRQIAAETRVIGMLERLSAMYEAYEAGRPWRGDLLPDLDDPSTEPLELTNAVELSFLENKSAGWRMPFSISENLQPRARMSDELNSLHSKWRVLSVMSPESPGYYEKLQDYTNQLQRVGVEVNQIETIRPLGEHLPELMRMMHALRIWAEADPEASGENAIEVGRGDRRRPLTLETLRAMLGVDMPSNEALFNVYRQLESLDVLLPLARRNNVREVAIVKFHDVRDMRPKSVEADLAATQGMGAGGVPGMPGGPGGYNPYLMPGAPGGGAGGPAGPGGGPAGPGGPGGYDPYSMYGAMGMGIPGMPGMGTQAAVVEESPGFASLVELVFRADNESAVKFLYDVVNDPRFFRLEGVQIQASAENPEIVTVDVLFEFALALNDVSFLGTSDLRDDLSGLPKPLSPDTMNEYLQDPMERFTCYYILAEYKERQRIRGIDADDKIEAALAEAGLPGFGGQVNKDLGVMAKAFERSAQGAGQ